MSMSKPSAIAVAFAVAAGVGSCGDPSRPASQNTDRPADTIFVGDNIVTMDPNQPTVAAVAIRFDTITAAGTFDDVMALRGESTRVVELGDRALLPGFIDAHGHLLGAGRALESLSLHSPPVGDINNIDDIVGKIQEWIAAEEIPPGETVVGTGYDDSLLAEGRHPTRFDLDRASTEHQIVLTHVSGHLRAVNSTALETHHVTADTPDSEGGHIRRVEGSMEPNGVLEERAGELVAGRRTPATPDELDRLARKSIRVYTAYGTTTIQEGSTGPALARALRAAADREPFEADVAAFPRFRTIEDAQDAQHEETYRGGLRMAGVKFSLDGSPQGRTTWVTEPYDEAPAGAASDYRAYGTLDPGVYKAGAALLIGRGMPIIVHANGDAAMDLMLDGVEEALADIDPLPDHRSVIIHAQLMRADQLDRAGVLNVMPSFFSAHAFFWGDWHRRSFGEERGNNISPVRWAIDRGVQFTVHNDAPIVPPDIMRLISITVNRKTRSGHVLWPHQRATIQEALHAVTFGAAYQYFEEDPKGSISVWKQADLVILGRNPLTTDPAELEGIEILETFSRGRSVHKL